MFAIGGASTEHGARNVVEAATGSTVRTGQYLDDGVVTAPSALARDRAFQDELHRVTDEVLRPWR
jgi:hypothetical protein